MTWLFLVGFMGVGKTTLGMELANKLGRPFYDLDDRVETAAGAPIAEIFSRRGESAFRELETRALASLVSAEAPGVVATGGGAFTVEEVRRIISHSGTSIWIDVPIEVLEARIGGSARPLWSGDERVRELADKRRKDYRLAKLHVALGDQPVASAVDVLYRAVAPLYGSNP